MRERQNIRSIKRLVLILAVAIIVFCLAAWQAKTGKLVGLESGIFLAIYKLPSWFTPVVYAMTLFGSSLMFGLVIVLLLVLRRRALALQIFITGSATYILFQLAKILIARDRPALLLADIHVRDPLVHGYGFPSGHTAMATAISLTLLPYLPGKWKWLVPVWIFGVAFSRVYLGAHAPLDIIGGLAIGISTFCLQQIALLVFVKRNEKV